ncbi:crotonase/enoyl-CoA hydratase family protein [Iamia sp. SCSIO 61187]|uniref:crotonase/enoyl-CoA hydratase family protein n=1 Tax=Iamia sp. SCSIO 61187 TaxID=2722752 RepID=UPI001C62E1FB|nr:crotonase/enoyl-CoA hydratase family protein [Iamia sp. SCSIO 61187]QYG91897.1 crotonase/enoyl-CoA hydratase family protein [Iamia sp. SCSIO 61187]
MSDTRLTYADDGAVATIALDDGRANVLSPAMQADIGAALDRAESAGAAVLLTGRPGRFSGGFDLAVMAQGGTAAADMVIGGFELAHRLLSFPRPVVVACTGHAIAMGAFLLTAADVRIGIAEGAHRIQANEVQIGMTLPRAAIEVCRGVLSPAGLRSALDLATPFDHGAAVGVGFLDEVVPEPDLAARARQVAGRAAGLDAVAHRRTKLRTRAPLLDALRAAIDADRTELAALLAATG